jgi:hypothetical protein
LTSSGPLEHLRCTGRLGEVILPFPATWFGRYHHGMSNRSATMKRWVAAILLTLWTSPGCEQVGRQPNNVPPDEAAKQWSEKLKIPFLGAACTTVDSDGDGYVSCVLSINTGDAPPKYQSLQCAELGSTKAGGCKPDAKNPDVIPWR